MSNIFLTLRRNLESLCRSNACVLRAVLALALLACASGVMAQGISSQASGDWNTPATWAGGIVPDNNDAVTILSTHVVTTTASEDALSLDIQAGGILDTTGGQLTIVQTLNIDGLIQGSGPLIIQNSGAAATGLAISPATATGITFSGDITVNQGDVVIDDAGGVNMSGSLTIASGNFTTDTQSLMVFADDVTVTGNIAVNRWMNSFANGTMSATGTIDISADFSLDSSGSIISTGAMTVDAGTLTNNGGTITANGGLLLDGSVFNMISGTLNVANADLDIDESGPATTVNFGTGDVNVTNVLFIVNGDADVNLGSGPGEVTLSGAFSQFQMLDGQVNGGSKTLESPNGMAINNNGIFDLQGAIVTISAGDVSIGGAPGGQVSDSGGGGGAFNVLDGFFAVGGGSQFVLSDTDLNLNDEAGGGYPMNIFAGGVFTSGTGTVTVVDDSDDPNDGVYNAGTFTIGSGGLDVQGTTGFFTNDNTGTLAIGGNLTANQATAAPALVVTSTSGVVTHSAGTVDVNGATISVDYTMSGTAAMTSSGAITVDAGTFDAANTITSTGVVTFGNVSAVSTMTFNLNSAALNITGNYLDIGETTGGTTAVNFDAGTVTLTNASLIVSQSGSGTAVLDIADSDIHCVTSGGILSYGDIIDTAGAGGSILVDSGRIALEAGVITLTDSTLDVTDEGADPQPPLQLGNGTFTSGTGLVSVTDNTDNSGFGIYSDGVVAVSTVNIGAGGIQVLGTAGHLELNGVGVVFNLDGDLTATTLTTGSPALLSQGTFNHISGAIDVNGAEFSSGTFSGTTGSFTSSGDVTISGGAVDFTTQTAIDLNAGLNVTSGSIDLTGRTITVEGDYTIAGGATYTTDAATDLTFDGAAAQAVSLNGKTHSGLLTIANSASSTVTFTSTIVSGVSVDVDDGTLVVADGVTFNATAGPTSINTATAGLEVGTGGSAFYNANTQTLTMTAGTIDIDSSAATALQSTTFTALDGSVTQTQGPFVATTVSFDGSLFDANDDVTISNTFALGDAVSDSFQISAGTLSVASTSTITGAFAMDATATVNFNGLVTVLAGGSIDMNAAANDLNCNAGLTTAGSTALSSSTGNLSVTGAVATFSGAPSTLVGAAGALQTSAGMTVSAATTLTCSAAAQIDADTADIVVAGTLNAADAAISISAGAALDINVGGVVNYTSGSLTIPTSGAGLVVDGTLDVGASTISITDNDFTTNGSVTDSLAGGSIVLTGSASGNLFVTSGATFTLSDHTTLSVLGTIDIDSGAFNSANAAVTVTNIGAAASAIEITDTGVTGPSVIFGNAGAGSVNVTDGGILIQDGTLVQFQCNVSLNNGGGAADAFDAQAHATGTLAIQGNLTVPGTTDISRDTTMSGTPVLTSTGLLTVDQGTFEAAGTINANAGVEFDTAAIGMTFNLNTAALNVSGGALNVKDTPTLAATNVNFEDGSVTITDQNLSVEDASVLDLGLTGTLLFDSTGPMQTLQVIDTATVNCGQKTLTMDNGLISVGNSAVLDIQGAAITLTIGDIAYQTPTCIIQDTGIAGGSILMLAGDVLGVGGSMTLTDATLTVTDDGTDGNAPLEIGNATFTSGSGLVTVTDNTDDAIDGVFSGDMTIGTGGLQVNGTFGYVENAATYAFVTTGDITATGVTTAPALVLSGATTHTSGNINVKGAAFTTGTYAGNGGSFTSTDAVTVDSAGVANFTSTTSITVTGNFTVGDGGTVDAGTGSGAAADFDVSGDLIVDAGAAAAVFDGNARELTIGGNVQVSTSGGGAPDFDAPSEVSNITGNLTVSSGTFDGNAGDINVTGGFTHSAGTVDVTGDTFTVDTGVAISGTAVFVVTSATVNFGGNVDVNPTTFTSGGAGMALTLTGGGAATVDFNGNTLSGAFAQTLTAAGDTRTLQSDLVVDNGAGAAGTVTFNVGIFTVDDGVIMTAQSAATDVMTNATLVIGQGGGDARYDASGQNVMGLGSLTVNSTTANPNYSLCCDMLNIGTGGSGTLTQTDGRIKVENDLMLSGVLMTMNDDIDVLGLLDIAAGMELRILGGILDVTSTTQIDGTLNFDAGTCNFNDDVDVGVGGLLDAGGTAGGSDINAGTVTFSVDGTATLGGGDFLMPGAVSELFVGAGGIFTGAAGAVTVDDGISNSGTFTSGAGLLTVDNLSDDKGNGTITSSSTFTVGSGGVTVLEGGINLSGTGNAAINGAVSLPNNGADDDDFIVLLTGSATLSITANITVNNGLASITAPTTNHSGGTLDVNGAGPKGTVTISPAAGGNTYSQGAATIDATDLITKSGSGTWQTTGGSSVINAQLGLDVAAGILDFNGTPNVDVAGADFDIAAGSAFNGGSADIDVAGGFDFTTSGTSSLETATLNVAGAGSFLVVAGIANVGGATVSLDGAGDFTISGGAVTDSAASAGSLTAVGGGMAVTGAATVTLIDSTVTLDTTLDIDSGFVSGSGLVTVTNSGTASPAVDIDSIGTVTFGTGGLSVAVDDVDLAAAGIVNFNGVTQILGGDLVTDVNGSMSMSANVTITGNADINRVVLSHTAGTLSTTGTTTISANYTMTGTPAITSTGLLTVDEGTFAAAGTITASGGMTLDTATTAMSFDLNAATLNVSSNLVVNQSAGATSVDFDTGIVTVTSANVQINNGVVDFGTAGSFTIVTAGNLNVVSGTVGAGSKTITVANGNINLSGGSFDIEGATIGITLGDFNTSGPATVSDTGTVGGSLTLSAGEIDLDGPSITLTDATITVTDDADGEAALDVSAASTFTIGTGLVTINDTTASAANGVVNNGTMAISTGGLTVDGVNGFFEHMAAAVLTIGGNLTATGVGLTPPAFISHEDITQTAGTVDVRGALFDTAGAVYTGSGGAFTSDGDVDVNAAQVSFTATTSIALTSAASLTLTAAATVDAGTGTGASNMSIDGDLNLSGTGPALTFNGDAREIAINGDLNLNATGGGNDFNGSTEATTVAGSINIDEGAFDTAALVTVSTDFSQTAGTAAIGAAQTLSVGGNFSNTGPGGIFDGSAGTLTLTGAATKTFTTTVTNTDTQLQNLTVAAGAGYQLAAGSILYFAADGTFTNDGTFGVADDTALLEVANLITTSVAFSGATATTLGDVTLTGSGALDGATTGSVNIVGDLSAVAGMIDWATTQVDVNFSGTNAQTITTNTTVALTTQLGDTTFSGTGGMTLANGNGFLSTQAFTISATGNLDVQDNRVEVNDLYDNNGVLDTATAGNIFVFLTDSTAQNFATGGTGVNKDFYDIEFASGIRQLAAGEGLTVNNAMTFTGGALELNNNDSTVFSIDISNVASYIDLEGATLTVTDTSATAVVVSNGFLRNTIAGGVLDVAGDFNYTSAVVTDFAVTTDIEVLANADVTGNYNQAAGTFSMDGGGAGTPVYTCTLSATSCFNNFHLLMDTWVNVTSAAAINFKVLGTLTLDQGSQLTDAGTLAGADITGLTSVTASRLEFDNGGPYVFGDITAVNVGVTDPDFVLTATGANTITTGVITFLGGNGNCTLTTQNADITFGDITNDNASNNTNYTFSTTGTGNVNSGSNPTNNIVVNGGQPTFSITCTLSGTVSVGDITHNAASNSTYTITSADGVGTSVTVGDILVTAGGPGMTINSDSAGADTLGALSAGSITTTGGTPTITMQSKGGDISMSSVSVSNSTTSFSASATTTGGVSIAGTVDESASIGVGSSIDLIGAGAVSVGGNVTFATKGFFTMRSSSADTTVTGDMTINGTSTANFANAGNGGGDTISVSGDVVINSTATGAGTVVWNLSNSTSDVAIGGSLTLSTDTQIDANNVTGNMTIADETTLSDGELILTPYTGNVDFNTSASAVVGLNVGVAATGIDGAGLAGSITVNGTADIDGGTVDFSGLAAGGSVTVTNNLDVNAAMVDLSSTIGTFITGNLIVGAGSMLDTSGNFAGIDIGGATGATISGGSTWTASTGGAQSDHVDISAGGLSITGSSTVTADSLTSGLTPPASFAVATTTTIGSGAGSSLSIAAAADAVTLTGAVTVNSTAGTALSTNSIVGALTMGPTTVTDGAIDLSGVGGTATIDGLNVGADITDLSNVVGAILIDGDFAVGGADGQVDFSNAPTLDFTASFDDDSAVADSVVLTAGTGITFTGTGAHNLDTGETVDGGSDAFPAALTIAGGDYTLSGRELDVTTNLTVTGGSLDQGTQNALIGTGGAGILLVNGTATSWDVGSGLLDVNGNMTFQFAAGGTLIIDDGDIDTLGDLTMDGADDNSLLATSAGNSTVVVAGDLVLGGGAGVITANIGATGSTGATTFTVFGDLNVGLGVGGASLTLGPAGIVNLSATDTLLGNGGGATSMSLTTAAHVVNTTGLLDVDLVGTLTMDAGSMTIGTTSDFDGLFDFDGGSFTSTGLATLSGTGNFNAADSGVADTLTFSNGWDVANSVTLGGQTLDVDNALLDVTDGSFAAGGTINANAGASFTASGGAITVDLNTASMNVSGADLTLSDGANSLSFDLDGGALSVDSADIVMSSGAVTGGASGTLSVTTAGDFQVNGGSFDVQAATVTLDSGDLILNGGDVQDTTHTGGSVTLSGGDLDIQSANSVTLSDATFAITDEGGDGTAPLTIAAGGSFTSGVGAITITDNADDANDGIVAQGNFTTSSTSNVTLVGGFASYRQQAGTGAIGGNLTVPVVAPQTAILIDNGATLNLQANSVITVGTASSGKSSILINGALISSVGAGSGRPILQGASINETDYAQLTFGATASVNVDGLLLQFIGNSADTYAVIFTAGAAIIKLDNLSLTHANTTVAAIQLATENITPQFFNEMELSGTAPANIDANTIDLPTNIGFAVQITVGPFIGGNLFGDALEIDANASILWSAPGPLVVSVAPLSNAFDVATTTVISATFDANMAAATSTSFVVIGSLSGQLSGTYSGASTDTLSFTPDAPLLPGEVVEVTLTDDLEDTVALALEFPYVWRFTIASLPSTATFGSDKAFGPSADNSNAIATGDLDGDGFPDAVVANDGQNSVYINDGEGQYTLSSDIGGASDPSTDVALSDLNLDGFLDIVVVNDAAQNVVYLNDGSAGFSTSVNFGTGTDASQAVDVADFNGDSFPDIIVGNDGQNVVYLNDGAAAFPTSANVGAATGDTRSAKVGDMNNDGKIDAVFANFGGQNEVAYNNGLGAFTTTANFGTGTDDTRQIALADIDDDGLLDIVTVLSGQNVIYFNTSGTNFATSGNFGPGTDTSYSVAVGDFDGDDDLDIAVGNSGIGSSEENSIYFNDGTGVFGTTGENFSTAPDYTADISVVDVDGDGDVDMVLANFAQQNVTLLNGPLPETGEPRLEVTVGLAFGDNLSAFANAQGAVLGQWSVEALDGDGALTSMSFNASGTADESAAISRVRLFRDLNSNGAREANEPQLGSQVTSMSDNGVISYTFSKIVLLPTDVMNVLLVADLSGAAVTSQTLNFFVASSLSVTSVPPTSGSTSSPVVGTFPARGPIVTIGNTARPQIGAITLDSSVAIVQESGLTLSAPVKNVGGNDLQLDSAEIIFKDSSGEVATIAPTTTVFADNTLSLGESTTMTLTYTLPASVVEDIYSLDLSVFGTDVTTTINVSDIGATAKKLFTVIDSLTILTTQLPKGTVGLPYVGLIEVLGGLNPRTVSITSGSLPSGLSLSAAGLISGFPQEAGSFDLTFEVVDAESEIDSVDLTIEIAAAFAPGSTVATGESGGTAGSGFTQSASIFTTNLAQGAVSVPYKAKLSGAPSTGIWSLNSGLLPTGMSFTSSGLLLGTPTVADSYTFQIRLVAGDSFALQQYTVVILDEIEQEIDAPERLVYRAASGLNLVADASGLVTSLAGNAALPASIDPSPALDFVDLISSDTDAPSLVSALYFDVDGSGTVNAGDIIRATMSETILVQNATIDDVQIESGSFGQSPAFTAEQSSDTFSIILGQGSTLLLGLSRLAIPVGSQLTDLAGNTALVSNVFILSGAAEAADIELLTLHGEPIESFSSVNVEWQTKPQSDSWTVDITLEQNGSPVDVLASGVSNTGLFVWNVPGSIEGGGYEISIVGHNATLGQDFDDRSSASFSIVPAGSLDDGELPDFVTLPDVNIPDAEVGLVYAASPIVLGGSSPYTWEISAGSLPAGLSINASTGEIGGTPTTSGNANFTIRVTDSEDATATRTFQVQVFAALKLLSTELPAGALNQSYSSIVLLNGGASPFTWSISSGSLPTGLSLSGTTGATQTISGTPIGNSGAFVFDLSVTDTLGATKTRQFQIEITGSNRLVAANGSGLFSIDPADSEHLLTSGVGTRGFLDVEAMAYDSSSDLFYAVDLDSGLLLRVDPVTGTGSSIGPLGYNDVRGLAYDSTNDLLYGMNASSSELLTIDRASGEATLVGAVAGFTGMSSLVFDDSTDLLLSVDANLDVLLSIDPAGPTGTNIGAVGFANVGSLAFGDSGTLFGVDLATDDLISINTTTGAGTSVGLLATSDVRALGYRSSDSLMLGVASTTAQVFDVDTSSASMTGVGSIGFDLNDLAFDNDRSLLYGVNALTNELVSIDLNTYGVNVIGDIGVGQIEGLAYRSANATLYGADVTTGRLVAINVTTGQGTVLGNFGGGIIDVRGLALNPLGPILYGADTTNGQLVVINVSTGAGASVGAFGSADVRGLAFDSNNNQLLASDSTTGEVFNVNVSNGIATPIGTTGYSPIGLAYNPISSTLYGASSDLSQVLTIDATSALGASVDSLALADLAGLAFDPSTSTLYGVDSNTDHLYSVDAVTGQTTTIGAITNVSGIEGLAYDDGGSILYGVVPGTQQLVTINTSTGVATAIGGPGSLGVPLTGLAYNDTTDQLFGSNSATGDLYEINTGTGVAALVGSFTGSTVDVRGLAINQGSQVLYGVDATNNTIVTIDTGSGVATVIGTALAEDIEGLAWR